jgi:hypothetical protein
MGNVKFRLGQDRRNNPRFWIAPNSSFLGLRPLCGTTLENEYVISAEIGARTLHPRFSKEWSATRCLCLLPLTVVSD